MNVVVLLSLSAAVTYGLSDFIGGVLTRRASAWAVAAASQAAALVLAAAFAAMAPTSPPASALAWGALGGVGSGAGNVLIYRGLGSGRMTVVAPVSAVAAAVLPVIAGIAGGERPGAIPLIGVAAALPAVWLVSGGGAGIRGASRRDLMNGLGAGLGFGTQFSALGQIPASAGLTPLALSQVVSVGSIVIAAVALSAPWVPRDRFSRLGVFAGLLAGIATICFQFATQSGMLTIAAVLTSLYPAVTVVLAAAVLRERVRPLQSIGLVLAGASVALIATG
jgi:drug/metabolite transporter (DMT)-like permease